MDGDFEIEKQILIANDNLVFTCAMQKIMQNDCVDINCTPFTEETLDVFLKNEYGLIILSIQPSTSRDMAILRLMRESKSVPIIALTQKLSVSEKITLFHAGANVCLEESVDIWLCAAQACSLIQLYLDSKKDHCEMYHLIFGTELIINPIYRQVIVDGELLELTRTEFDLLHYMASHPNQIFSRQ